MSVKAKQRPKIEGTNCLINTLCSKLFRSYFRNSVNMIHFKMHITFSLKLPCLTIVYVSCRLFLLLKYWRYIHFLIAWDWFYNSYIHLSIYFLPNYCFLFLTKVLLELNLKLISSISVFTPWAASKIHFSEVTFYHLLTFSHYWTCLIRYLFNPSKNVSIIFI